MNKFDWGRSNRGHVGAFFDGRTVDVDALEDELVGEMFDEVAEAFADCDDAELDGHLGAAANLRPALFGLRSGTAAEPCVLSDAGATPTSASGRRQPWGFLPFRRLAMRSGGTD